MSETPKTLKELMWEIHHAAYGLVYPPDLMELLPVIDSEPEKPHRVADTTGQQSAKN